MDYPLLGVSPIACGHTLFDPDGCLGRPLLARLCNSVLIMDIQNKFDVITRIPGKMVIAVCEQESINYSTLFLSYLLYMVCLKPHSCNHIDIFPKLFPADYHEWHENDKRKRDRPGAAITLNMDHTEI